MAYHRRSRSCSCSSRTARSNRARCFSGGRMPFRQLVVVPPRGLLHAAGLVFLQDLPLPLEQPGDQRRPGSGPVRRSGWGPGARPAPVRPRSTAASNRMPTGARTPARPHRAAADADRGTSADRTSGTCGSRRRCGASASWLTFVQFGRMGLTPKASPAASGIIGGRRLRENSPRRARPPAGRSRLSDGTKSANPDYSRARQPRSPEAGRFGGLRPRSGEAATTVNVIYPGPRRVPGRSGCPRRNSSMPIARLPAGCTRSKDRSPCPVATHSRRFSARTTSPGAAAGAGSAAAASATDTCSRISRCGLPGERYQLV